VNYRHKRTGITYRLLFSSFSVERQRPSVVYVDPEGRIFDRDAEKFGANFELIGDSQDTILPKQHHE
jgi:hypothetical protein